MTDVMNSTISAEEFLEILKDPTKHSMDTAAVAFLKKHYEHIHSYCWWPKHDSEGDWSVELTASDPFVIRAHSDTVENYLRAFTKCTCIYRQMFYKHDNLPVGDELYSMLYSVEFK